LDNLSYSDNVKGYFKRRYMW